MPIIETKGLTKRYAGGFRSDSTLAVDDISFSVEAGQVFGFLGPNGSGKTTTIGMLLGIISPTAGAFRLFGGAGHREILAARQRIGATLEYPNFYPYLSCRDNLRVVARVKGRDPADVDRVLEIVGLAQRQKTRFKACSLGMKQRLAIGATLLGDPDLIILDEPANGLDPAGQREIRDVIRRLAQGGKTIFLSSHILHDVERVCTHVAIIQKGRLVRQASVSDVTSERPVIAIRSSGDIEFLRDHAGRFPGARSVEVRDDVVLVDADEGDAAGLNRYLVEAGIPVAHLSVERQTLESIFMELTSESAGFGSVV